MEKSDVVVEKEKNQIIKRIDEMMKIAVKDSVTIWEYAEPGLAERALPFVSFIKSVVQICPPPLKNCCPLLRTI